VNHIGGHADSEGKLIIIVLDLVTLGEVISLVSPKANGATFDRMLIRHLLFLFVYEYVARPHDLNLSF
jgi:hypothetical protein